MNTKPLLTGLGVAGVILLASVGLKAAELAQLIEPATTNRTFQAMMGLLVAFYGNAIPKSLGAWRNPEAAGRLQAVQRLAGWSLTLAGLAYAGLSVFAPNPVGDLLAVLAAAVAITMIYAVACRIGAASAPNNPRG